MLDFLTMDDCFTERPNGPIIQIGNAKIDYFTIIPLPKTRNFKLLSSLKPKRSGWQESSFESSSESSLKFLEAEKDITVEEMELSKDLTVDEFKMRAHFTPSHTNKFNNDGLKHENFTKLNSKLNSKYRHGDLVVTLGDELYDCKKEGLGSKRSETTSLSGLRC